MGFREAGGAWRLALLLSLFLNLLAKDLQHEHYYDHDDLELDRVEHHGHEHEIAFNDSLSLEAALAEPIVRLVNSGENLTQPKEVEFGECTVTCGIGIREVILTNGCPGGETKCIVRVEECRGPADCGWGKPISESLVSVKIPCIFVPPENRFQYVWKMLIPDQQSLIIPNDSAILEVHRNTHPVAFECDTLENDELIASVKYTVYTTAELETRRLKKPGTDIVLIFVLITGVIVCVGVIFAVVFIILNWTAVKTFWQTKVWKSKDELGSMRTASGITATIETSQLSQAETLQDQGSYHEWKIPPGEGGGGGEGGEEGEGDQ